MKSTKIRKLNASFAKSGKGSMTSRLILPIVWLRKIGVNADDKSVDVYFDEEKEEIVIRKHKE